MATLAVPSCHQADVPRRVSRSEGNHWPWAHSSGGVSHGQGVVDAT